MYKTNNKLKIKEKLIITSNCAIRKNRPARLVELVDTSDLKSDFN